MSQPTRGTTPGPGDPHAGAESEWTFQRDGHVFGPVSQARLREMMFAGEVRGDTPVSENGGRYRQLSEVGRFLVDLRKAEAHLRVEREVTDSRRVAERRRRMRRAGLIALALLLAGGGLGGAAWLAATRPWQRRSALLEDFGQGIAISAPARIGVGRDPAPQEEDLAIPADEGPPAPGRPTRAVRRPAPRPARAPDDGLVQARWDQADIQAVVAREQRSLAPCLREESRRSPDFAGEIPIEFAIGNDGRVAALWIDEPRFRSGPLHGCLLRTLQGWRFKPFPGQQPVVALAFRVAAP
jgi:hypothetical protein